MSAREINARLNRRQFLQFSGFGLALTASGQVMQVVAKDHADTSTLSAYITVGADWRDHHWGTQPGGGSGREYLATDDHCRGARCRVAGR
jgi:hypothetical protein